MVTRSVTKPQCPECGKTMQKDYPNAAVEWVCEYCGNWRKHDGTYRYGVCI